MVYERFITTNPQIFLTNWLVKIRLALPRLVYNLKLVLIAFIWRWTDIKWADDRKKIILKNTYNRPTTNAWPELPDSLWHTWALKISFNSKCFCLGLDKSVSISHFPSTFSLNILESFNSLSFSSRETKNTRTQG